VRRATGRGAALLLSAAALPGAAEGQGACSQAAAPSAAWTAPLDRVVTPGADLRALPLRVALERLAAVAGVRLSYSRELLPLDRPSCLDPAPVALGAALARLLAGTGVSAVAVADDQVVLAPASVQPPAVAPAVAVLQQVVVTGSASAAPARRLPFAVDALDGRSLVPVGRRRRARHRAQRPRARRVELGPSRRPPCSPATAACAAPARSA
jgi:hypothetical protein